MLRTRKLTRPACLFLAIIAILGVGISALATNGKVMKSVDYADITMLLDGKQITLTDVNSNAVEPFAIDGTTYIPVRAMSEAMGYDVSWNQGTSEISITSKPSLVVGTFNIDAKAPQTLVADQRDLMAGYGVEIFGVQEVDVGLARYGIEEYDPFTDFTASTYTDGFFGMSHAKGGEGAYGNGVVSAFALKEATVTELYGAAQAPQDLQELVYASFKLKSSDPEYRSVMGAVWGPGGAMANGGIEPRSYSRIVFEKDGKEIAFYSTHLSVEALDVRMEQLQELREVLDNDPVEYKILVGDFNTDTSTSEYDIFLMGGYRLANGNNGVWFNTVADDEVARDSLGLGSTNIGYLDNIIVSGNIRIDYVQMIRTDLSDHNALIAGLTLN